MLSSYRWRRRLLWIGLFVGFSAGIAVLVATLPNVNGPPTETFVDSGEDATPQVAAPRERPLSGADRRAVTATLVEFVRGAVAREDPAAAWALATPGLRAGTTRAEWVRGELPVFPYPAIASQARGWQAIESYRDEVFVTFVLQPPKGSKRGPIEFSADLKAVGEGEGRRWLVDALIPIRVYPAPGAETRKAAPKPLPENFEPEYPGGRLSPLWFVVPGLVLALIVIVPVTIALLNWRRGRRAERAYRSSLNA